MDFLTNLSFLVTLEDIDDPRSPSIHDSIRNRLQVSPDHTQSDEKNSSVKNVLESPVQRLLEAFDFDLGIPIVVLKSKLMHSKSSSSSSSQTSSTPSQSHMFHPPTSFSVDWYLSLPNEFKSHRVSKKPDNSPNSQWGTVKNPQQKVKTKTKNERSRKKTKKSFHSVSYQSNLVVKSAISQSTGAQKLKTGSTAPKYPSLTRQLEKFKRQKQFQKTFDVLFPINTEFKSPRIHNVPSPFQLRSARNPQFAPTFYSQSQSPSRIRTPTRDVMTTPSPSLKPVVDSNMDSSSFFTPPASPQRNKHSKMGRPNPLSLSPSVEPVNFVPQSRKAEILLLSRQNSLRKQKRIAGRSQLPRKSFDQLEFKPRVQVESPQQSLLLGSNSSFQTKPIRRNSNSIVLSEPKMELKPTVVQEKLDPEIEDGSNDATIIQFFQVSDTDDSERDPEVEDNSNDASIIQFFEVSDTDDSAPPTPIYSKFDRDLQ